MYIWNVFKRLFLYQVIFVSGFLHNSDLPVHSSSFKDKLLNLTKIFTFKHQVIDQFCSQHVITYRFLLLAQVGCAALAVLGSGFFAFITALLLTIDTAVHFHPFNPANPQDIVIGKYAISFELIVRLALIFAILADAFKSNFKSKPIETKTEKKTVEKRDAAPGSKKTKKTL